MLVAEMGRNKLRPYQANLAIVSFESACDEVRGCLSEAGTR